MKTIYNQYLEIRGRLQLNFATFNLYSLLKLVQVHLRSHNFRICPLFKRGGGGRGYKWAPQITYLKKHTN